ncbi:MAG TPA: tetratricopeptide repeat protein [Lacipirellulaceae bacterium]|nr:tetratricopeptide repeat protein [Lacipirellulaceae bacterium]
MSLAIMVNVRWLFLVLSTAIIPVGGCGGSTSTSAAYDHFVAAADAINAGDKEKALSELTATIDSSPSAWAYFERARIYLEKGQEQDAISDCQQGLVLDPKDRKLLWLSAELKKPAAQRFKGRFAKPPA